MTVTRRRFMQMTGAGAGAVALGHYADPVEEADALGPVGIGIAVGGAAVADSVIDWTLRDGGGKDAEEATAEATKDVLQTQLYQAAKARKSANESRILDQTNLIKTTRHIAYEEGKTAAIEQINQGATESEVLVAAKNAANNYLATPKKNILKQWNESLLELDSYLSTISNQGLSGASFFSHHQDNIEYDTFEVRKDDATFDLPDGNTISVHQLYIKVNNTNSGTPDGTQGPTGNPTRTWRVDVPEGTVEYLNSAESGKWSAAISEINSIQTEVMNGLSTYVSNVYGQVQSGELDPSQLFTSQQFANRAVEEGLPRAKADLLALNVPVDLDREMTITTTFPDDSVDQWRISGMLAATTAPSTGFQVGNSYTPDTTDSDGNTIVGSVYMAVTADDAVGSWTHYNTGIDGGVLTFTEEPDRGAVYTIRTTDSETATVEYADFSQNDNNNWEVDLSGQLQNTITSAGSVEVYMATEGTVQIQIENQFTVELITDETTGEEYETATPEEPVKVHTDSNYQTAEEFRNQSQQRQEDYEKLRELFEEVEGSGGGLSLFGGGLFPTLPGFGIIESAVIVVAGLLGISALASS